MRLETAMVHAGELRPRPHGAVSMPIFQSSTFEYGATDGDPSAYHALKYIRLNNTPNHVQLHAKLAALEGAEAALATGSGMAAISTTLLALLSPGDRILAQDCLYGGTRDFFTGDLEPLGIGVDFVDPARPETWAASLRERTRAIYLETISNPLMQVADLPAAIRFARERGLVSIVDNTFASPVHYRAAASGFDLAIHSATKYLNGHSDLVAGAIAGRADLVERVRKKLNHLGGSLDPHGCWMLDRGIKTLALRVRYQSASALAIARFLESHPAVARVHYPGLESHPGHALARSFLGGFGGMLAFEPAGGTAAAEALLSRVEIPIVAPSLGGVETLLTRPALTSHVGMAAAERARLGIGDALVRMSVGVEALEDLLEDLERALQPA